MSIPLEDHRFVDDAYAKYSSYSEFNEIGTLMACMLEKQTPHSLCLITKLGLISAVVCTLRVKGIDWSA